ncbi:hypothetical protein [Leptothrix discophora]|uniref:Proline-rich protein n=1 Tax=Leptothrix discophora TaxID=89 RepID=A0ABT9G719_LEPDI|nr:hypothetical protein [Leptothrix discophora]MDP4302279.1 hypothetical protein [Leptothrix discophora]
MAEYFRKTERGRREVRERSLNLSRTARNLLLILDSSKSLTAWIDMIQGATLADAVALLEAGLIESPPNAEDSRPAQFEPTEPMGHTGWQVPSQYAGLRDPANRTGSLPPPVASATASTASASAPAATPAVPPAARPTGARATSGLGEPKGLERPPGAVRPGGQASPPASSRGDTLPGSLDPLVRSAGPASRPPSDFGGLDVTPLPPVGRSLGYTELYDSLNALLRESLGLFRGYRYTLRIEKAQNIAELEQVARDFIDEVHRVRGESMARMVQRALGLGS